MRSGVWVRLPWHHTLKPLLHPSPAARKPHPTTVIVIWHFSAQTLTALYTARLVYPFILSELSLWHSQSDGELRQVSTLAKDIRRGSNGCEKCKLGGLEVKLWFHCLINVNRTYHHHVSQAGYCWSSEEPRPVTQQQNTQTATRRRSCKWKSGSCCRHTARSLFPPMKKTPSQPATQTEAHPLVRTADPSSVLLLRLFGLISTETGIQVSLINHSLHHKHEATSVTPWLSMLLE